jgi:hypothetical protein
MSSAVGAGAIRWLRRESLGDAVKIRRGFVDECDNELEEEEVESIARLFGDGRTFGGVRDGDEWE